MTKEEIRRILISKREALTAEEALEKSHMVTERLLSSGLLSESAEIMSYSAFRNEVDATKLNQRLLESRPEILLPYTDESLSILPCLYRKGDPMIPGRFGVLLPTPLRLTKRIPDIVIIPCVGVDTQGNRLGFGKGCYDRYFRNTPVIKKIILAYDFQVLDELPFDPLDVPADYIVTESSVIQRR